MERRGHPRTEIKDAQDYNDVCTDMLDAWLDDFNERGLLRPVSNQDLNEGIDDDIQFMYTDKAMFMYDRYCKRLFKLGMKYFNEFDLEIQSYNVIEG